LSVYSVGSALTRGLHVAVFILDDRSAMKTRACETFFKKRALGRGRSGTELGRTELGRCGTARIPHETCGFLKTAHRTNPLVNRTILSPEFDQIFPQTAEVPSSLI